MSTYFVSTSGSNGNPGLQDAPFATIARGLSALNSGDTLLLRGGTYPEYISNVPSGATISGYSSESAVLRPPGGGDHVIYLTGNYRGITFNNLIIDAANVGHNGIKFQGGPNGNRVQNCEIRNAPESGILLTDGSIGNVFVNLNIHNNGRMGYAPPVAAYGMYIATAGNIVDGCAIHDNVGYGIHNYSASGGADNNTIRNNRIYSNGRSTGNYVFGLLVGPGGIAYNNLIYSNQRGLQIFTGSGQAYFNTIYGNINEAIQVYGSASLTYKNNIIFGNGQTINGNGNGSNNLVG